MKTPSAEEEPLPRVRWMDEAELTAENFGETARIWVEDLKTPILTTKYHSSYMTGGNWSPTRPGVFFTTRNDGVMDVWDFFYKQNDPVLSIEVSEAPLTSFNIQSAGQLIVAGDASGTTTMYELSEGLTVMQQNEKQSVNQLLELEAYYYERALAAHRLQLTPAIV